MGILNLTDYLIARRTNKIENLLMNLEKDIKASTRQSEEYYKTDNTPEINESLYQKELRMIHYYILDYKHPIVRYLNQQQIKKLNDILYERANLWDEFRREGLKMRPVSLERLIVLEECSYCCEVDKLKGIIIELKKQSQEQVQLNFQEATGNSQEAANKGKEQQHQSRSISQRGDTR